MDFDSEDLAEGTGCDGVPGLRWDETTKPMSMDPLHCWSMPVAQRRTRQLEALRLRLYRLYLADGVDRKRLERIMPYIEARLNGR